MSNKTVSWLFIIVIVLAALLAVRQYVPSLLKKPSLYLEQTKDMSVENIHTINIKTGSTEVTLSNKDGAWMTQDGMKADAGKIESLLSAFIPITTAAPELIAQTDARYSEFGLDKENALEITLNKKLTLYSGKNAGLGTYVRFKDKPHVYIVKNAGSISADTADWYDKTVIAIPRSDLKKLTFKGLTPAVLTKQEDGSWTDEKDQKADPTAMDLLLSNVETFEATGLLLEKDVPQYMPRPEQTVIIEYKDTSETLMFYKQTDNYIVEKGSDKQKFSVASYMASVFTDAPGSLFPTPTPAMK